jgi:hypothetical protein
VQKAGATCRTPQELAVATFGVRRLAAALQSSARIQEDQSQRQGKMRGFAKTKGDGKGKMPG